MNMNDSPMQKQNRIGRKTLRAARQMAVLLVAAAFLITNWMSRVEAAAGELDPSFGNGGIVMSVFGAFSYAHDVAGQAAGNILISGAANRPGGFTGDSAIGRYLPDGSPDTSFGSGGVVTTDFGGI